MRTPVPKLIRRPSRSTPSVVLALLLLTAGGLGAWLTGHRLVTGTWPDRTVTTRRSRVDVVVLSVLDDLNPVQEAARKTTDEALETLQPAGITRSRVRIKRTS